MECLLRCQRSASTGQYRNMLRSVACSVIIIIIDVIIVTLCFCFGSIYLIVLPFFFFSLSDTDYPTDPVDFMYHNTSVLPGPPSKPAVTDVTKSSISLSWEPGPETGSPVSFYVLEAFGYVFDLRP